MHTPCRLSAAQIVVRKLNPNHLMKVLSKAALLAYERLHVAQRIVDREWNDQNDPNDHLYTSELEAAWCFDVIRSGERLSSASPTGQMWKYDIT